MVWLGPGGVGAPRPRLHDAPPGYKPPRQQMPLKEQRRRARRDWTIMRVATIVLVVAGAAFMVLILTVIATHI
jgi:hypothetical protein